MDAQRERGRDREEGIEREQRTEKGAAGVGGVAVGGRSELEDVIDSSAGLPCAPDADGTVSAAQAVRGPPVSRLVPVPRLTSAGPSLRPGASSSSGAPPISTRQSLAQKVSIPQHRQRIA